MKEALKKWGAFVYKKILRNGALVDNKGNVNGDMYSYKLNFKEVVFISSTRNPLTRNWIIYHTISGDKLYQRNSIKGVVETSKEFVRISKYEGVNISKVISATSNFSTVFLETNSEPKKLKVNKRYQKKLKIILEQNYLI